jgi:hypothetical protein
MIVNGSINFLDSSFYCPHCGINSHQEWYHSKGLAIDANRIIDGVYFSFRTELQHYEQKTLQRFNQFIQEAILRHMSNFMPSSVAVSLCLSCNKPSVWVDEEMIYPNTTNIEPPNPDLNEDIKDLYLEAASIVDLSPKGAAAILRLALQTLMTQLGKNGQNINDDIKQLVAEGLDSRIQQSMDILRVVGNNAVHPGKIDFNDKRDVALKLFSLLNLIANELITKPKEIERLYADIIPEGIQDHIKKRDKKE